MRIDLLSLLLVLSPAIRAAVLAIDYGAEFTKLSLVKPGVPFDVVLDRDSKRKISSVVGWKRDDRVFGAEGKMASTRFPDTHYPYIKPLIGRNDVSHPELYPSSPEVVGEFVIFPHPSPPSHLSPEPATPSKVWTPAALLAHQISYFRGLAEDLAGTGNTPEAITQVIVTVPAWWNIHQRKTYRDALELQGLTCLAMISEGTAVALNYAMTRTFPNYDSVTGEGTKEYHVIYDSGALGTTASVIGFWQTSYLPSPKSKTLVNTTHIELLGVGWEEAGGAHLDLAVRELLVKAFEKKPSGKGVRGDKRAMMRLLREANRVKQILSANQESNVAIESLYQDIDFKSKLSRSDLETAVESLIPSFRKPITQALSQASLTINDLTSLILFGGNTRVPLVQSAIKQVLGSKEDIIAQNVNSDEAAVLGAAYYGAALSRQFKVKNLEVVERSIGDIKLDERVVFPHGSKLGERKWITLDAVEDKILEFSQGDEPILSLQFLEIANALANFTAPSPVINLTMRLDPKGHLSAASAVLVSNVTDTSTGGVAGALKGLFGGKQDEVAIEAVGEEGEATEGKEVKVKESKADKVVIRFREKLLGSKHMTGEEKRTTMARLTSIALYESAKTAREEARNLLEGYLYRLQALLDPESDNPSLKEFSTEQEQSVMSKLLKETFEWLSDNAEKAEEKILKAKRAALETLEAPIIIRFKESQTRYTAIEAFQQAMFMSRNFLVEANKNNTEALEAAANATEENPVAPPKYTIAELSEVEEKMKELEVWMDTLMEEQMQLEGDKTKDPVIFTKDLDFKGKDLQMMVLRLINKKPPRLPKVKPSKSASSSSSSSSTAATTEATASPSPSVDTEEPFLPTADDPVETESSKEIPKHEEL